MAEDEVLGGIETDKVLQTVIFLVSHTTQAKRRSREKDFCQIAPSLISFESRNKTKKKDHLCFQTELPIHSPAAGIIEEFLVADGEKVQANAQILKLRVTGETSE